MPGYRMKTPRAAEPVCKAYKAIEIAVLVAYRKIEHSVVGAYQRVESRFVDAFLQQSEATGKADASEGK